MKISSTKMLQASTELKQNIKKRNEYNIKILMITKNKIIKLFIDDKK